MNTFKRATANLLAAFALTVLAVAPLNAATYFYHTDHLGTPQALTDENQQVVWQGEQNPFGENTPSVNVVEQNLRFPGQYYDSETGLHYNYYRDYDPSLGAYIESDPIGLRGGINTYGYVGGDPLYYSDPYGLCFGFCTVVPAAYGVARATQVGYRIYKGYKTAQTAAAIVDAIKEDKEKASEEGESCPVEKDVAPGHPDFVPHKKKKDKGKIPWNKNRKGFPDKKGNYWEPVPDGHKGSHDPHWDVQHPDGTHTPKYPPK